MPIMPIDIHNIFYYADYCVSFFLRHYFITPSSAFAIDVISLMLYFHFHYAIAACFLLIDSDIFIILIAFFQFSLITLIIACAAAFADCCWYYADDDADADFRIADAADQKIESREERRGA